MKIYIVLKNNYVYGISTKEWEAESIRELVIKNLKKEGVMDTRIFIHEQNMEISFS